LLGGTGGLRGFLSLAGQRCGGEARSWRRIPGAARVAMIVLSYAGKI